MAHRECKRCRNYILERDDAGGPHCRTCLRIIEGDWSLLHDGKPALDPWKARGDGGRGFVNRTYRGQDWVESLVDAWDRAGGYVD